MNKETEKFLLETYAGYKRILEKTGAKSNTFDLLSFADATWMAGERVFAYRMIAFLDDIFELESITKTKKRKFTK